MSYGAMIAKIERLLAEHWREFEERRYPASSVKPSN
jgi:hypothetical protein